MNGMGYTTWKGWHKSHVLVCHDPIGPPLGKLLPLLLLLLLLLVLKHHFPKWGWNNPSNFKPPPSLPLQRRLHRLLMVTDTWKIFQVGWSHDQCLQIASKNTGHFSGGISIKTITPAWKGHAKNSQGTICEFVARCCCKRECNRYDPFTNTTW